MSDLWNIQPGDKVFWKSGYSDVAILEVTRVTAAQIFVKSNGYESGFWKKNGNAVGTSGAWRAPYIQPLTPERIEQVEIASLSRRAVELRDKLSIPTTKPELEAFVSALEKL